MLEWIIGRCKGEAAAEAMGELLAVDRAGWAEEYDAIREYLRGYGRRLPGALTAELDAVVKALRG